MTHFVAIAVNSVNSSLTVYQINDLFGRFSVLQEFVVRFFPQPS